MQKKHLLPYNHTCSVECATQAALQGISWFLLQSAFEYSLPVAQWTNS